jgi:hypothetical protein
MSCTAFLMVQIFASAFLVPHPYEYKTATRTNDQVLIQGVSEETAEEWVGFLLAEGVGFSIQGSGSELLVGSNPIAILQEAQLIGGLEREARRALQERRIESRVSEMWPQVSRSSVCIASESVNEDESSVSREVVFVVAPNFPRDQIGQLHQVVGEYVKGVSPDRIQVLGSVDSMKHLNPTQVARGTSNLSSLQR